MAGSIWKQGVSFFNTLSPIDEILERDSYCLEDLLDEDELLQEVKAMNQLLVDYLCTKANLEKLIDYITIPPGENEAFDELKHIKFPYMACEVLCCNLTCIMLTILEDHLLLARFFQIFDCGAPIEPRLAGYFFKVLELLLQRKPDTILLFISGSKDPTIKVKMIRQHEDKKSRLSILKSKKKTKKSKDRLSTDDENVQVKSKDSTEAEIEKLEEQINSIVISDSEIELKQVDSGVGWLMPKLVKHIESYSITCFTRILLQEAASPYTSNDDDDRGDDEYNMDYDNDDSLNSHNDTSSSINKVQLGDARNIYLGHHGSAMLFCDKLGDINSNTDIHNNCAEILILLLKQLSSIKKFTCETKQHDLVLQFETFKIEINEQENKDEFKNNFKNEMMEAFKFVNNKWTLDVCKHLLTIIFDQSLIKPESELSVNSTQVDDNFDGNPFLSQLLPELFNPDSCRVAALKVISQVISTYSQEEWLLPMWQSKMFEYFEIDPICHSFDNVTNDIDAILEYLPQICTDLLSDKSDYSSWSHVSAQFSSRMDVPRLHMVRLNAVEIICKLVFSKYTRAINEIANCEKNPLGMLIDLFFEFEWNNVLHSQVQNLLGFIFSGVDNLQLAANETNQPPKMMDDEAGRGFDDEDHKDENDSNNSKTSTTEEEYQLIQKSMLPLQRVLFGKCNLLNKLIKVYELNGIAVQETEIYFHEKLSSVNNKSENTDSTGTATSASTATKLRRHGQKGYMGFCHRIVNDITKLTEQQRTSKSKEEESSTSNDPVDWNGETYPCLRAVEENPAWDKLVQVEIAEINDIENRMLGGEKPTQMSLLDLDLDDSDMLYDGKNFDFEDDFDHAENGGMNLNYASDRNMSDPDIPDIDGDDNHAPISTILNFNHQDQNNFFNQYYKGIGGYNMQKTDEDDDVQIQDTDSEGDDDDNEFLDVNVNNSGSNKASATYGHSSNHFDLLARFGMDNNFGCDDDDDDDLDIHSSDADSNSSSEVDEHGTSVSPKSNHSRHRRSSANEVNDLTINNMEAIKIQSNSIHGAASPDDSTTFNPFDIPVDVVNQSSDDDEGWTADFSNMNLKPAITGIPADPPVDPNFPEFGAYNNGNESDCDVVITDQDQNQSGSQEAEAGKDSSFSEEEQDNSWADFSNAFK